MEAQVQRKTGWAVWLVGGLALVAVAVMAFLGMQARRGGKMEASGRPAPQFALADLDGKDIPLYALGGKVVMVDFWATWCGPCRAEMPALVSLAKEYAPKGLVFLAANADGEAPEDMIEWTHKNVPDLMPYLASATPDMVSAYNVSSLPTLVFIDRKGQLLETITGAQSEPELRRLVERALSSH